MLRETEKILVCAEDCQLVAYAKLGKDRVDRAHLDSCAPAPIAQLCCVNVVLAVRPQAMEER